MSVLGLYPGSRAWFLCQENFDARKKVRLKKLKIVDI